MATSPLPAITRPSQKVSPGRFPAAQPLPQHILGPVKPLGPQIGFQQGVLKHLPLGVAAADAGQLRKDRLQEVHRGGVVLVGKSVNALGQGQDNLLGQPAALFPVGPQAVEHPVHQFPVAAGGKGQGGVGVAGRPGRGG